MFEDLDPDKELKNIDAFRTNEDKKKQRRKENKKKRVENPPTSLKSILGSKHMMASPEDKQKFNQCYAMLYAELKEVRGEKPIRASDELLLHALCYAAIRMGWKARLESDFGRFMDRIASHDPTNQITSISKALGLTTTSKDGKESGSATTNDALSRLLGEESKMLKQGKVIGAKEGLDYDSWTKLQEKETPQSLRRSDEFNEIEEALNVE